MVSTLSIAIIIINMFLGVIIPIVLLVYFKKKYRAGIKSFLAMRYVLKQEHDNAHNALMYGAGHGGIEMVVILTLGMLNYLIYSVMINLGLTQMLLEPLDNATRDTLQTAFDALIQTPSWQLALSPVERLAAITAQIGFSVIVWLVAIGIILIAWNVWKKEAGKSM